MGSVLKHDAWQDTGPDTVGQWISDNRGPLTTLGKFYFDEGHKSFDDWSKALLTEIPEHHKVTAEHLRGIWSELSGENLDPVVQGLAGSEAIPWQDGVPPDSPEREGEAQGLARRGVKRVLSMLALFQNRLGLAALVLLFLYFFYPTPYEYAKRYPNVVRVNRFTGREEYSTPNGWAAALGQANDAPGEEFASALQIVHFENDGSGVYISVRNVGQETTPSLKLRCSLLDSDGVIVDSGQTLITAPLKTGDTAEVQIYPSVIGADPRLVEVASVRLDSAKAST